MRHEFTFRFTRRRSHSRGKFFFRLIQQAVATPQGSVDQVQALVDFAETDATSGDDWLNGAVQRRLEIGLVTWSLSIANSPPCFSFVLRPAASRSWSYRKSACGFVGYKRYLYVSRT